MSNFKTRLQNRGYPARTVEKHLSEIKFSDRKKVARTEKQSRPKEHTVLCNAIPPGVG